MPRMDWNTFQDAHYRPHLVIATLEGVAESDPAGSVAIFERLATALGVSGNYAFKSDGHSVSAAFEVDVDAERFAGMLQGRKTVREPEWASRTVGRIDGAARRRIVAAMKKFRLKRSKRPSPIGH